MKSGGSLDNSFGEHGFSEPPSNTTKRIVMLYRILRAVGPSWEIPDGHRLAYFLDLAGGRRS